MPTRPNFIILGAAKAGTTALYRYLARHPDVYVSPLKETNFLALEGDTLRFCGPGDDEYVNRMSITSLPAYEEQFRGARAQAAVGEASPLYLYSARAVQGIRRHAPEAKLVAILRDPVERAFSAYLHTVRDHREPLDSFDAGLDAEEERIDAGWEHLWHYKRMGLYHEQLERYYAAFPAAQIRVFLYRDLRLAPEATMRSLLDFIGADSAVVPDMSERHNATAGGGDGAARPCIKPETRARLREYFAADAQRLGKLIARDVSHWFNDPAAPTAAEQEVPTAA